MQFYNGEITLAMDKLIGKHKELSGFNMAVFSFPNLNPSAFCDELLNYAGDLYAQDISIKKIKKKVQNKIDNYYVKFNKAKSRIEIGDPKILDTFIKLFEVRMKITLMIINKSIDEK